jgi:hypothetical protein
MRTATIPRKHSPGLPALDERRTLTVAEVADILVLRHELQRILGTSGAAAVQMDVRQGR